MVVLPDQDRHENRTPLRCHFAVTARSARFVFARAAHCVVSVRQQSDRKSVRRTCC
jgi:hypothetical protein